MGLRAISAFASAGIAFAAACTTFDETPEVEGADADGGPESGADGPAEVDGARPDAGGDARLPCRDRGPIDPNHFCDDFDREGALDFGWSELIDGPDGAVGELFMTGGAFGTSFRGRLPASKAPPGRVQLAHRHPPPAAKYRVELDVRVDSIPHLAGTTSGYSHLLVVQFDDAPCATGANNQRSLELSLYAADERVTLLSKGLGTCPATGGNIPPKNDDFPKTPSQLVDGKFHHVSIAIEKSPCPGTESALSLRSTFDDFTPACRPLDLDVLTTSSQVRTFVGPYVGSNGYEATSFVYDNVTIDFD